MLACCFIGVFPPRCKSPRLTSQVSVDKVVIKTTSDVEDKKALTVSIGWLIAEPADHETGVFV